MKYQFAVLTLTISTILFGISIPFPYRRDTAIQLKNCDENVPHVVVVNKTDGRILNCHKCIRCQLGHGLNIPCSGQNVSLLELHIECERCVAGFNYSTADSIQCKPCLPNVCNNGVQTLGACEADGDKRTCKHCELKNWYYNKTERICQPCFCQNMTDEIKRICTGLGFKYDSQCDQVSVNTTVKTSFAPHSQKRNTWDIKFTIVVIVGCLCGIVLLGYLWYITKRVKNFKLDHPSLTACTKEWFCQIFLFKRTTTSRPPSDTTEAQNGHAGREGFARQNSCPVTKDEKYLANQGSHAPLGPGDSQEMVNLIERQPKNTECKQKNLKFFDMNSEVCRQVCRALRQNIDSGMGYPTLAGYMDFSANDVKGFNEKEDPCEEMLSCWSNLNKKNTVLKLKELVVKLKRYDIVEMIESELKMKKNECGCYECSASC